MLICDFCENPDVAGTCEKCGQDVCYACGKFKKGKLWCPECKTEVEES